MKLACLLLALPLVTSVAGCNFFRSETNHYQISIVFEDTKPASELSDVKAIVGGDKFNWPVLKAGQLESANLYSSKSAQNNLTLLYRLGSLQKTWELPEFEKNTDYKIQIKIDSSGTVNSVSCQPLCPTK
jgi:hypothetical protein